jgi:putative protease
LRHDIRLRDRRGVEHRLLADSQCRNTLFHAEAQNLSALMPELRNRGVSHFRVELLNENSVAEVRRVMAMYQPSNGTS